MRRGKICSLSFLFLSLSDVYDFIVRQKLLESGGNVVKNDRFPPDSSKNCFVGGGNLKLILQICGGKNNEIC